MHLFILMNQDFHLLIRCSLSRSFEVWCKWVHWAFQGFMRCLTTFQSWRDSNIRWFHLPIADDLSRNRLYPWSLVPWDLTCEFNCLSSIPRPAGQSQNSKISTIDRTLNCPQYFEFNHYEFGLTILLAGGSQLLDCIGVAASFNF